MKLFIGIVILLLVLLVAWKLFVTFPAIALLILAVNLFAIYSKKNQPPR